MNIQNNYVWWSGPPWLSQHQNEWPRHDDIDLSRTLPELQVLIMQPTTPEFYLQFSSFDRLQRCVAWIRRFFCATKHHARAITDHLTLEELNWAKTALVKLSQRHSFPNVIERLEKRSAVPRSNPLAKLRPSLDDSGILRVCGRDGRAYNIIGLHTLKPALMARTNHITLLLVRQAHLLTAHGGPSTMLAHLASRWHIPACKQLASKVSAECAPCQRTYARPVQPPMADLPTARVTPTPPFTVTGIDYAGPFLYRTTDDDGEERMTKCYICVVCFCTKAVHLEIAYDLSAAEFVATLQRFTDRRGVPGEIYSDNGTNFRAAQQDLQAIKENLKQQATQTQIIHWAAQRDIQWHFSPARAPHFGGLWEAAVKAMKTCLRKVVGQHRLNLSELMTVVTSAEASLNGRPLAAIESLADDGVEPLTPMHFLTGRPPSALLTDTTVDAKINNNERWNLVQILRHRLWNRFFTEYVTLLKRHRPHHFKKGSKTNVRPGDIVMIKDKVLFQNHWPLGRIINVYPGPDGAVRRATVWINGKPVDRAARHLVIITKKEPSPLPPSLGESVQVS